MTTPNRFLARRGAVQAAIVMGFFATLVFTVFMHSGARVLTGFPMDVTELLAAFFSDDAVLGTVAHYVTGTIAYPMAYLVVRVFLPASPLWRGALWGGLLWLVANAVLLPILGTGFFMSNLFHGAELLTPELASFLGHVIYGVVLGVPLEGLLLGRKPSIFAYGAGPHGTFAGSGQVQ